MTFQISPSPRVRRSPFFEATVADGVVSFSPYNHMLMPTGYGDPDAEYWRLINTVAMWDVSVERQVQLEGRDAEKLAQILTPRNLAKIPERCGWYVPICDHRGVIINDPILLKHSNEKFWFSIADGDLKLWARAIAAERGLDVVVTEPDVSPLAVQGPLAEKVVAALLGDEIKNIRHFHFRDFQLDGIPLVVARSGWSHQGGFELYLCDGSRGTELWERVKEAGEPFGIGPGNPNPAERIESGLLSWGGDTDDQTNPFEVRMGRYVDLDVSDDVVGIQALRTIAKLGPSRHQLGVQLASKERLSLGDLKATLISDGASVGTMSACSWSPRLDMNIGICLVDIACVAGQEIKVEMPQMGSIDGTLCDLPFKIDK